MPEKRPPIGLSTTAVRRVRRTTVTAVLLLALMAAVLSFDGLQALAVTAGISPALAWILPLTIDGLVVVGSLGVITATLVGTATWYFWLLTLLGVIASVIGNVAAAPPTLLAQAVHAIPPLVFALAVEGLLAVYRASAEATNTTAPAAPTPAPQSVTAHTEPAPGPSPETTSTSVLSRAAPTDGATARERLRVLLAEHPDVTGREAADILGIDGSHARRLLREERHAAETQQEAVAPSATATREDAS